MKAVYMRQLSNGFCWLGEETVDLEFTATQSGDTVDISFTDETKLRLYALRLTPDEIVGCDEVATEATWESERAACAESSVRQREGRAA